MLLALLFAVVTLGQAPFAGFDQAIEGYAVAPSSTLSCQSGQVCAKTTVNGYGCYAVNVKTNNYGGSPLAIDLTQNGAHSATKVFWVNNTGSPVTVTKYAYAYYYCRHKT